LLEVLSEFGYAPIWEKPEKKLADFIRKSLETRLSKTIVDAILQESVQSTKKPFEEILLNPKTFSTIFEEIFGKKITHLILKILHEDLLHLAVPVGDIGSEFLVFRIQLQAILVTQFPDLPPDISGFGM